MKKIFTLISAAVVAVCVNAQTWTADAFSVPNTEGGSVAVDAGTTLVDNALLKASTVYGSTAKTDNANGTLFGTYKIKNYMQVRVDSWPSASNPAGGESNESTSVKIEAKKDVKLSVFYRRQAQNGGYASADGKDIVVYCDGIAQKAEKFEKVADKGTDGKYAYCLTEVTLKAGKTYYAAAKGTTLCFMGFDCVETTGGDTPATATQIYENTSADKNADGFSIMKYADGAEFVLVGNSSKSYSAGLSKTYEGATYKTSKVSNGAQNKFIAPEGKKVAKVQFLAYVNIADDKLNFEKYPDKGYRTSYWKEVNGEEFTVETTHEYTSRTDLQEAVFKLPNVSEFTFTNTGEQLCFVMIATYSDGTTSIVTNRVDNTESDVFFNLAGQRVGKNAKGIVIGKNGKKYIR